jgi:LPXTG-motif cell wall-anchored protein
MRKLLALMNLTVVLVGLWATSALAQQYPPATPPAGALPEVITQQAPEVAVTGAAITVWFLILLGLVIVGGAALVAGRRRAKTPQ